MKAGVAAMDGDSEIKRPLCAGSAAAAYRLSAIDPEHQTTKH
jgi:hypothetical protein